MSVARSEARLRDGVFVGEHPFRAGQFIDGEAIGFEDQERSVADGGIFYDREIENFDGLFPDEAFIERQERLVDSAGGKIFFGYRDDAGLKRNWDREDY